MIKALYLQSLLLVHSNLWIHNNYNQKLKLMKLIYSFIVALCFIPLCSFGQPDVTNCSTLVIDFSNGAPLTQNGVTISFPPGQIEFDLSSLTNVNRVSIQEVPFGCCNNFYLYSGNTLVDSEIDFGGNAVLNNTLNLNIDKFVIVIGELTLISVTIYHNCPPACDPKIQVESEQGDVYVDDPCYGTIFTSADGTCFRMQVENDGTLITEAITCP